MVLLDVSSPTFGPYRFQGTPGDTRRYALRAPSRISSSIVSSTCIHALPPSRAPVRSRALLMARINFVIKSSRIITEHDRGRLDRPAVPRHDEIIKDQLQRALSADRPYRGFARAPTTALYLRWQWFMVKLAYLDCLFIGEISYGPIYMSRRNALLGFGDIQQRTRADVVQNASKNSISFRWDCGRERQKNLRKFIFSRNDKQEQELWRTISRYIRWVR